MTLPVLRPAASAAPPAVFEPLREFAQLQQRMTDLLSTVLDSGPLAGAANGWTPPADITETDDAYVVEIGLPGVNRKRSGRRPPDRAPAQDRGGQAAPDCHPRPLTGPRTDLNARYPESRPLAEGGRDRRGFRP